MKARRVQPTEETITILLNACTQRMIVRSPNPDIPPEKIEVYQRARNLFERIPQEGIQMNRIHINAMLKCISRTRDWPYLFQLYKSMNRPGSAHRNESSKTTPPIIKQFELLKKNGGLEEGMQFRDESFESANKQLDEYLDPKAKSAVDDADLEKDLKFDPAVLRHFRPDMITYSIMLSACAGRGGEAAFEDAMKIWADVQLDADESDKNVLQSRELFVRRRKQEILSTIKKHRQPDDCAEKLMGEAEDRYPLISIDAQLIHSVLMSCKNARKRESIESALLIAQEKFGDAFDWSLFDQYLKSAEATDDKECPFTSLLQSDLGFKKPGEGAINFNVVSPNSKTVSIMMDILSTLGLPTSVVLNFYKFMTTSSNHRFYVAVQPDTMLTLKYIELIIKENPQEALSNIDLIRKNHGLLNRRGKPQIKPVPLETYHLAFKACAKTKNIQAAEGYWQELKDISHRFYSDFNRQNCPNAYTAIMWLNCLLACQQPQLALHFLKTLTLYEREATENSRHYSWWHELAPRALRSEVVLKRALKICDLLGATKIPAHENCVEKVDQIQLGEIKYDEMPAVEDLNVLKKEFQFRLDALTASEDQE